MVESYVNKLVLSFLIFYNLNIIYVSHPNYLYNSTVNVALYEFRQIKAHLICDVSKRFNLVILLLLYILLQYSMIGLMIHIFSLAFRGIEKVEV